METRIDQGTKKIRIDQGTKKTRMDQGTKKTRIDQGTKKTRMDQGTMKTRIDQGTKKTLDGPRKLIFQKHSKNRLRPQILKMLDRSLTSRSFLFTKHKNAALFSFSFNSWEYLCIMCSLSNNSTNDSNFILFL